MSLIHINIAVLNIQIYLFCKNYYLIFIANFKRLFNRVIKSQSHR